MQSSFFNKSETNIIVDLALEAGKIAISFFENKDFAILKKKDDSKVTSADIKISEFLRQKLGEFFPKIPVICEEGELREILTETFFLIDPIDGTSSFIKGSTEFCINIALIKDKKAVFGLIYAPLFEGGKIVFNNENNQIILNKNQIKISPQQTEQQLKSPLSLKDTEMRHDSSLYLQGSPSLTSNEHVGLRIITSSRSKDETIKNYLDKNFPEFSNNFTVEKLSSAIKFFRIIEGEANFYLHFRPSMEWDTAAGDALVGIMKKNLYNLESGEILTYKKLGFKNSPFYLPAFNNLASLK